MNVDAKANEDGSVILTLQLTKEQAAMLFESLPAPLRDPGLEAGHELMGLWPKAKHYCVQVRKQDDPGFHCQTTIYESPLWAWARAAGIGLRKAGTKAIVNMSTGRCNGPQDSCGVS